MHVLLQSLKLRIVAENYLKIEHNLLITKDNNLKNIKYVYSHTHAISQCKNNLKLLGFNPVNHIDTAGAAKFVSGCKEKENAAIASLLAAEIYNLKVIKKILKIKRIMLRDF